MLAEDSKGTLEIEQRQTAGVKKALIDLTLQTAPEVSDEAADISQQLELVRRAQQIVFLPHFRVTDHIFYGDMVDSLDPKEGLPTVRTALIDGENFHMNIDLNFNADWTLVTVYPPGRRAVQVCNGETDQATATWLDEQVLTPVRDELIMTPVEEDYPLADY